MININILDTCPVVRYKMCGSVRARLPGMLKCHQKISHTTTETPQTIPPDQWPAGTVAQPSSAAAGETTEPKFLYFLTSSSRIIFLNDSRESILECELHGGR